MIINHNIPAMNTNRFLNNNNNNVAKSLEKLSSGLRINKAGDDAAGLAISEKMRAQIRGLDMATKNAQDGVSLIQTAEGSLQTIENILQRMRELAVESSTDTNVNKDDREAIQLEIVALTSEIDRIAEQSEFNTQALLDGTFTGKFFHIGANTDQNISVSIDKMNTDALKLNKKYSTVAPVYDSVKVELGKSTVVKDFEQTVRYYNVEWGGGSSTGFSTRAAAEGAVGSLISDGLLSTISPHDPITAKDSVTMVADSVIMSVTAMVAGSAGNGAVVLNSGATAIVDSVGGKLSLSTQSKANEAIETINNAINTVSMQRAKLGAIQNRLEYSIENLEVSSENTSAAESRIRDVNMAKEMMNFTKNNILAQAATAMLAQANQTPQNVLSLLR